ncbi:MAG: divergent PAP2 family protein [Lachnospiraceae bacterium]|jgi:acid phosphatase family membrane protein YuiD|nr:divergent PAP2 family protein [Lachnospiraceae bacterium]
MEFIQGMFQNPVLVAAVMGWFVAQVLKTIIHLMITKKLVWERMVGSGGMPSSHSATVCALATAAGMQYGGASFEFAIAVIMAIVVMHDARGVRRETGIQAMILNEMMDLFREMGKKMPIEDKLKEFVGHTPLQVLMGAVLGICIGVMTCQIMIP